MGTQRLTGESSVQQTAIVPVDTKADRCTTGQAQNNRSDTDIDEALMSAYEMISEMKVALTTAHGVISEKEEALVAAHTTLLEKDEELKVASQGTTRKPK